MQEKTFFLENQETQQSELLSWLIPKGMSPVNLEFLLPHIKDSSRKILKIYNPENDDYITFGNSNLTTNPYLISRNLLQLNTVIIKYSQNPHVVEQQSSEEEEDNKKQRSRERNIREVIELVQKWREYHDNPPDGKRRTLQEAAKFVGVSKKSLDDYYYQLRVGEKHDFDFNSHMEDKIGALRAFLKIKQPQRKSQGRNAKHPKKLKIIQQFSQKLRITDVNNGKINKVKEQYIDEPQPKIQLQTKKSQTNSFKQISDNQSLNDPFQSLSEDQLFWGSPFTPLSQQKCMDIEKNFYDQFEFDMNMGDPYLNLMTKKSTVSINEENSNSEHMPIL